MSGTGSQSNTPVIGTAPLMMSAGRPSAAGQSWARAMAVRCPPAELPETYSRCGSPPYPEMLRKVHTMARLTWAMMVSRVTVGQRS